MEKTLMLDFTKIRNQNTKERSRPCKIEGSISHHILSDQATDMLQDLGMMDQIVQIHNARLEHLDHSKREKNEGTTYHKSEYM
jgi:hypothetical protein